jgi:hypothetical protein
VLVAYAIVTTTCCTLQHSGRINPADFELGARKTKHTATMGYPLGATAPMTTQFLRSHQKEPVLPERELLSSMPPPQQNSYIVALVWSTAGDGWPLLIDDSPPRPAATGTKSVPLP